jgi:hypothetical protein
MNLDRLLTGHGDPVLDHAVLAASRLADHQRRCERILAAMQDEARTNAWRIAGHLWSPRTVTEQPVLVVWEVLGHLDLLLDSGAVREEIVDDGSRYGKAYFSLRTRGDGDGDGDGDEAIPRLRHQAPNQQLRRTAS